MPSIMRHFLITGAILLGFYSVEAAFLPAAPSTCTTSTIHLSVTALNQRFASTVKAPSSPVDVANFYRAQFAANSNLTAEITLTGDSAVQKVGGTYAIFTKVCLPHAKWSGVVQVLAHGLDVDHRYWENPTDTSYSWIDAATRAGHATISYDRLGMGQSDHPDGLNVVQSTMDIEILNALGLYFKKDARFSHAKDFVVVGHSYGSIQSAGIGATHPDTFSKIILTGYSVSVTGVPVAFMGFGSTIAHTQNPSRYSRWANDTSYWVMESPNHEMIVFFLPPEYPQSQFDYFQSIKSPYTYGQILTIGTPATKLPAKNFTGELFVVTGDKDFGYCGGDCYQQPIYTNGTSLLDDVGFLFPAAKKFSTYIPPNTGHATNNHYSAPTTFGVVNKWLNGTYV